MRYFNALLCALLFSSSALLGNCSLASYSETRSFRDALDGRSMEDAISGPVDKDTSSYGDRTSSTPSGGAVGSSLSGGMQAPASSIMLNVPANGNLNNNNNNNNNMVPQQQEEQQRQSPELEREASPGQTMATGSAVDNTEQQPMMEQKSARQRSNRRPTTNPVMAAAAGPMRSSRQQPESGDFSGGSTKGSTSGNSESGFGEDQPTGNGKQNMQARQQVDQMQRGYNGNRMAKGAQKPMNDGQEDDDQQLQQQIGAGDQQSIVGNNNGVGSDQQLMPERSYASNGADDQMMAAKQRAMAAMLMSMNSGMKYSRGMASPMRPPINGQTASMASFGDKKASSMAQNMMASLANKAAYMGMQQQKQQQRQLAPPVMVSMIAAGYPKQSLMNGAGENNYNTGQSRMAMGNMVTGAPAMMNGYSDGGVRGGMRRANQRKVEKKMSPSMVNAMLNKMLSMKQKEQQGEGVATNGGYMKPATMAMLMKSPAGAEMLANMVMPQISGAMAGMPAAKKEQYKRMMMAAIMQQAATNGENYGDRQQQQLPGDSFVQQQMISDNIKPTSGKSAASRGYNNNGASTEPINVLMTPTTMSPAALMMSMMMAAKGAKQAADYDEQPIEQQRSRIPMTSNANGQYANRLGGKGMDSSGSSSRQNGLPMMSDFDQTQSQQPEPQQQQQQQPEKQSITDGGYSNGDQQQRELQAGMSPQPQVVVAMNNVKGVNPMSRSQVTGRPMSIANGDGNGYGSARSAIMPGMKITNGGAKQTMSKYAEEQKRQMDSVGFGGNDDPSADDEQQREMPATMAPANLMGSSKPKQGSAPADSGYSNDGMEMMNGMTGLRPDAPMNGFRQAYDQQQQKILDNRNPTSLPNTANMGTKSRGDSYQSSMPRPAPMQQSYGGQQLNSAADQQQQQLQTDDYSGAAPMGMAEPFAFDYKIEDDYGNGQYRKEESDKNGVVRGSYGYMDVGGLYRHVEYVADENGFRANIKSNEPGLSSEPAPSNGNSNNDANNNGNSNRSSGNVSSPTMSPTNMDSNAAAGDGLSTNDGSNNNPQQQLQQQLMMMMVPTQTELNENGEK